MSLFGKIYSIWKPYILGTRLELSITQAIPSGNPTSQGHNVKIEYYLGTAIWKRYFPGTRSKLSLTLAMP
jgi:hypothetical protein